MSAAGTIREALEATGELRVAPDAYGNLRVWNADDDIVLDAYDADDTTRDILRLLGILLAAAPYLEAVLDAQGPDRNVTIGHLRSAITAAGEDL